MQNKVDDNNDLTFPVARKNLNDRMDVRWDFVVALSSWCTTKHPAGTAGWLTHSHTHIKIQELRLDN